MIISSEITGKEYKTVEACLADEKAFKEKQEAEKKAKEEHQKKLDEAYKKAIDACEDYLRLSGLDFKRTENGYTIKSNSDDELDRIFAEILQLML